MLVNDNIPTTNPTTTTMTFSDSDDIFTHIYIYSTSSYESSMNNNIMYDKFTPTYSVIDLLVDTVLYTRETDK